MEGLEEPRTPRLLPETRPGAVRKQIPLDQLPPNDDLVSPEPTSDLIEGIQAVGLMFPIVVSTRPDGSYVVHDGRRRTKALRKLAAVGDTDDNLYSHADAVVIEDDGYLAHDTLTIMMNNTSKPNVIAELEAVERLVSEGLGYDEISKATGLPTGTIKARLKLSGLNGELRHMFKEGWMSPSTASKAARMPEAVQERLVSKVKSSKAKRLTGEDVALETRARRQEAVESQSLSGLSDMPTDVGTVDRDMEKRAELNLGHAVRELRQKMEMNRDRPMVNRKKWSDDDIYNLGLLLDAVDG